MEGMDVFALPARRHPLLIRHTKDKVEIFFSPISIVSLFSLTLSIMLIICGEEDDEEHEMGGREPQLEAAVEEGNVKSCE